MIDLEQEFQQLRQALLDKITTQISTGDLSGEEGLKLIDMVQDRLHFDSSTYGERCPDGHADPYCGWSPSMGYHCN